MYQKNHQLHKVSQRCSNWPKFSFGFNFSAMASEDIRNVIIGQEVVTEQGIDNSQLLSADLENFDINLKINNVLEDEENYYADYSFNTFGVKDNLGQPVVKPPVAEIVQEPPICQPTAEICDGLDNDCDDQIDEEVDCGITSCDTSLNLAGECQNTCLEGVCQTCTPTCTCAVGFSDCDSDMTNGCEPAENCSEE